MLIKTFTALFLTLCTTKAFAADPSLQDNDKRHQSAKTTPDDSVGVSIDIVPLITQHLDLKSSLAYLQTCKAINSTKTLVLLGQIPHMYQHRGLSTDVFFPFDHPQWTPEKLPIEIALNLHKNFFKALKTKTTEPLAAFKVFYAAGFFGHHLAAHEAGKMLLNPALNNTIPPLIYFKDLDPALDIKKWGVHRLNQSLLEVPELQEILDSVTPFLGNEYAHYTFAEADPLLQEARKKVDQITKEADEVKGIKIFLKEMHEYYQKHKQINGFEPEETIKFVKTLAFLPLALQRILDEEPPRRNLTLQDVEFKERLNVDLLQAHLEKFHNKVYQKEWPYFRLTPTARQFVQKIIPMQHVACFFIQGNQEIYKFKNWFNPIDTSTSAEEDKKFQEKDLPINVFFSHLGTTWLLDARNIESGYPDELLSRMEHTFERFNLMRVKLFKEAFSKAYRENKLQKKS